jgi:Asp-tRNA(Asn)/Glu-tRNA(Gln) amidotransferase C subunit
MRSVTRRDEVQPSLSPDKILANAPQRQGNCFKVKLILDQ